MLWSIHWVIQILLFDFRGRRRCFRGIFFFFDAVQDLQLKVYWVIRIFIIETWMAIFILFWSGGIPKIALKNVEFEWFLSTINNSLSFVLPKTIENWEIVCKCWHFVRDLPVVFSVSHFNSSGFPFFVKLKLLYRCSN